VAEYPVLWKTVLEGLFECIDLVNPFTDERALLKRVLVDVGDSAGIGIDTRFTAMQSRIA